MDLGWQGFGGPELRWGLSPLVYSLEGVVRMQDLLLPKTGFHTGAVERNSSPVLAGALWG